MEMSTKTHQLSTTTQIARTATANPCSTNNHTAKTTTTTSTAFQLIHLLTIFCFIVGDIHSQPINVISTARRIRRTHRSSKPSSRHAVCTSLCHGYYKMCDSADTKDWAGQYLCFQSFNQCKFLCDHKYAEDLLQTKLNPKTWEQLKEEETKKGSDEIKAQSSPSISTASPIKGET